MQTRCSIRDVAQAAGVSKSTAQRALANHVRCSPQTRERVAAEANRLGYRPDPVFASMGARRRVRSAGGLPLAYLECSGPGPHPGGPYLVHARRRAEELGYRIEVIDPSGWGSARRLWDVAYARGCAGVIVGSVRREWHPLLLGNDRFPMVCAGRIDQLPCNTVRPAVLDGVRLAHANLRARGFKRIGFALMRHEPPVDDDFDRHAAALACLAETRSEGARIPVLRAPIDDHAALLRWVRKWRPDAVVAFHPGMAEVLSGAGLKVPGDVAVAALHMAPRDAVRTGGLRPVAGVVQDYAAIARSVVNLIDQMIRHGEKGFPANPITIDVASRWEEGCSVPPEAVGRG